MRVHKRERSLAMLIFSPVSRHCRWHLFVITIIFTILVGCGSNPQKAPILDVGQNSGSRANRHTVKAGETLYSIALRYDLDYKKLSEINNLDGSYKIRVGQVLILSRNSNASVKPTEKDVSKPGQNKTSAESFRSKNKTKSVSTSAKETGPLNSIKWQWPVKGKVLEGFNHKGGLNKGIDIHAKLGEPVVAAADGEVVYSGSGLRGYGKLLIVKHDQNYLSAYAHNRVLNASEGDLVKAGQKIAEVGLSGTNTSKLHFEIRLDGKPVNPLIHLPQW